MTEANPETCDEVRLNLYLDRELGPNEMAWMDAHLKDCSSCRRQAATLTDFSRGLRGRVRRVADTVDFFSLEKQVLTSTLPRYRSVGNWAGLIKAMKFMVPAALAVGVLVFLAYTNYLSHSVATPSAIINSFTGSVSSVMIFETPETKQTILWYNEETDVESE